MTKPESKTALLSVSHKKGIADFAASLIDLGYNLISTGGTARCLKEDGLEVTEISDLTGFPEILDGRVKTLHPVIHGGILARRGQKNELRELDIAPIALVCCNLYPFRDALEQGLSEAEILEEIDIGGVTLLRAAAKNYAEVIVVSDPCQYTAIIAALVRGNDSITWRKDLAQRAFALTARYDSAITQYLAVDNERNDLLSEQYTLLLDKIHELRYGENPHQKAAVYLESTAPYPRFKQLNGSELSYNNIVDLDAALALVSEFDEPCVAFVKHTSPCGVAINPDLSEAARMAWEADSLSAYGGIVALNRPVDMATAESLMVKGSFLDCLSAPGFEEGVVEYLSTAKKWSERFKIFAAEYKPAALSVKTALGYYLLQENDLGSVVKEDYEVPTDRKPTEEELRNLIFAFKVVKYVRSNGIVLAKDGVTIEMGGGAVNRVWPVEQAIARAGARARGAVMASDGFFPMPDGPEAALKAGVTAIIHPGGSKRDQETAEICDKYGAALVIVGLRHFRH